LEYFKVGDEAGMGRTGKVEKGVFELWAPAEYWALTAEQHADICNGCGPAAGLGFLVPDTMWGLCVTDVCDVHDYMYHVGETVEDKAQADRVMLNNAIRKISYYTSNRWLKMLRLRRARTYYAFVSNYGGPAFWAGKNNPDNLGNRSV
jgi:hypothetical protein